MVRILLLVAAALLCLQGPAFAGADRLMGAWRGEAALNGDATPIIVEFAPCDEGMCGHLTMPELEYARLPLGPASAAPDGGGRAGSLTLTAAAAGFSGVLSAHGDIVIDAFGHGGGEARVSLERGQAPRLGVQEEEVSFSNGSILLAGTLVRPRGRGPHPAILAVLGSGPAVRWYSLGRAREWARLGYVVLVYDKRGAGASTGSWLDASLDDLADDAVAGFRYLQTRPDVRRDRVGVWAHSQGGWVAPRAIARGAEAAFLIAVSGGGASPLQVERYGYGGTLDHLGVQGDERARADALVEFYFSYLRGDVDLAALRVQIAGVRTASWYRPLGISRVIPSEESRGHWAWVVTYDPSADIAALRAPVLVALAGADHATPLGESVEGWTNALAQTSQRDVSVKVYPAVDHHQRAGGPGWRRTNSAYRADVARFLIAQRDR